MRLLMAGVLACSLLVSPLAFGQASEDELAKKLQNPVADLISLPFQFNFDEGHGTGGDGTKLTLNIQPVIPIDLTADWMVISRTIVPVIYQHDVFTANSGSDFGLGDITQSLFFSPKNTDLIWGVGPVFLLPTATDDQLGSDQWGVGPTAVLLKQSGPWTIGILANHIWSVAGDDDHDDVNSTFLQPFVAYALGKGLTVNLQTESTYDWTHDQWTVPVIVGVSQVFKLWGQPVSLLIAPRYYIERPDQGPDWGVRIALTFLFPK